ncbi:MAG: hypothetical protein V4550_14860 [Gemmatimonadota bacterium]
MSETTLDLSSLESDYEFVGELSGRGSARTFIATRKDNGSKRREDDTRVLVSVISTPNGDEGNALSHLAADTQLLAGLKHRRLIPVIEGRWIGKDAYAIVTQRTTDPSLAERLAGGETFTTPRAAAILREINGLIEWAREHNVVHRGVRPHDIFLEPKTDRVHVSFCAAPISRIQRSDPGEDARTIARLAMVMLTGKVDPQNDARSINDIRPELPARLGEATATLLDPHSTATPEDVATYIALIGMADPLFAGEAEADRIRKEVYEEQRVEREKLAAERAEFERMMAAEKAAFEQRVREELAAFEASMTAERARLEQIMTADRELFAAERAELQRAVAQERVDLVTRRAQLEHEAAEQRAAVEAAAASDRQQLEILRTELMARGEQEIERKRNAALEEITDDDSVLESEDLTPSVFIPLVASPFQELDFDNDAPLLREASIPDVPSLEASTPIDVGSETGKEAETSVPAWKRWLMPASVTGGLAILIAAGVLMSRRETVAAPPVKQVAVVSTAPVSVAAPTSVVPLPPPAGTTDSAAGQVALDSVKGADIPKPVRKRKAVVRRDTIFDSVPRFRTDSVKPDTVRPDTIKPLLGTRS